MKETLSTKNHYVRSRIEFKVKKFQKPARRKKGPHKAQETKGIEIQPLVLEKVLYGQLKTLHVDMVKEELNARGIQHNNIN